MFITVLDLDIAVVDMECSTSRLKIVAAMVALAMVAPGLMPVLGSQPVPDGTPLTTGADGDTGPSADASSDEPLPVYSFLMGPKDADGFGSTLANLDDVDGDGVPDLLIGSGYGGIREMPMPPDKLWPYGTYLLLGREGRDFTTDQLLENSQVMGYWSFRAQRWLGDVNGDGHADVVQGNDYGILDASTGQVIFTGPGLEIRYGTAAGIPEDADQFIDMLPEGVSPNYTYVSYEYGGVGDVNGDGLNDLFVYRHAIYVYPNGAPPPGRDDEPKPPPEPQPEPKIYPGEMQLYFGSANGFNATPDWNVTINATNGSERWSSSINHADVNGDGHQDVILNSYSAPHILVYHGNAHGMSAEPDTSITFASDFAYNWRLHAPVDVDGDGYDDVLLDYGMAEGLFRYVQYVYVFRGSSRGIPRTPSSEIKLESGENAQMVASDVNGDGLTDAVLVWTRGGGMYRDVGDPMDVFVRVHFNSGGSYKASPSYVQNVTGIRNAGYLGAVETVDIDGDGFGDVAIGITGTYIFDPSGQYRTSQGQVMFVYGAGIMDRLRPLTLLGGPVLYAGLKAYDFRVNANPTGVGLLPGMVWLILDPTGANVTLGCNIPNGTAGFNVVSDPSGYVTLGSTVADRVLDPMNNTAWLHFKVVMGWNWPHEDLCHADVMMFPEVSVPELPHPFIRTRDLFRVENDLELVGPLSVSGEWQGARTEGQWVRSNERITLTGPIVVYEGTTDVFPPSGAFTDVLQDDDGDFVTTAHSSGAVVNLTIAADGTTDLDENYTLTLQDLPGTATLVKQRRIHLRVDGDAPAFRNAVPEPDDWHGSSEVLVSITADDHATSGVVGSTLEYSYTTTGASGAWTEWSREGLTVTPDGGDVDGLVTLALPDGTENFVRWRAGDRVGNGPSVSDAFRIKVDTKNVTFSSSFPDPNAWQTRTDIECGVTIHDTEGAGIDVSTVQYRVSFQNLSHYGPWMDWEEGSAADSQTLPVSVLLALAESPHNYVQWRAIDIAGNGYTTSPHYRVRVDVTPIAFYAFTPPESEWQTSRDVTVQVNVSDKEGGSGASMGSLQYRYRQHGGEWTAWASAIPGTSVVKMDAWFTLELHLLDGTANGVQVRGSDAAGNGPTESAQRVIWIDTTPPEFGTITPPAGQKQPSTQVTVRVTMWDAWSGLSASKVWYRYGTDGEGSMGDWALMPVLAQEGAGLPTVFDGVIALELARGKGNVVQFRAQDVLGHENMSAVASIWVNQLPTAAIASPKWNVTYTEDDLVELNATGSSDPDGDALNYTWWAANLTEPLGHGRVLTTRLPVGVYELTLVVKDPVGEEASAKVPVTVERLPPPRTSATTDMAMLLALLVLVLVGSVGAGYYVAKRQRA
jgi:hypothetical protein